MERDIVAIVAEKLESAQQDHAFALREVELAQDVLDAKTLLLHHVEQRLNDIENIHDAITPE